MKAVILAGGKGTRLSFHPRVPKPLLPFKERPSWSTYSLPQELRNNRRDYNHKPPRLPDKELLRRRQGPRMNIEYYEEKEPLGTAAACSRSGTSWTRRSCPGRGQHHRAQADEFMSSTRRRRA